MMSRVILVCALIFIVAMVTAHFMRKQVRNNISHKADCLKKSKVVKLVFMKIYKAYVGYTVRIIDYSYT